MFRDSRKQRTTIFYLRTFRSIEYEKKNPQNVQVDKYRSPEITLTLVESGGLELDNVILNYITCLQANCL